MILCMVAVFMNIKILFISKTHNIASIIIQLLSLLSFIISWMIVDINSWENI